MPSDEFALIKRFFEPLGGNRNDVLLGIGDDAAVLDLPDGTHLVAATDTLVEQVHFDDRFSSADIGYRALAVNLSDFAAVGARPAWALLSLSLPEANDSWLDGFATGFRELAQAHAVVLIGGDTTRGPLNIAVTLLGYIQTERRLTRSGARPGNRVYVTGTLGDAAGALAGTKNKTLMSRLLRPKPRVAFGCTLHGLATAAIDVSDGLLADCEHLTRQSGVGARIDGSLLPISDELRTQYPDQVLDLALTGGDDYELLFTTPPDREKAVIERAVEQNLRLTCIGEITEDQTVTCVVDGKSHIPSNRGYVHFGGTP